MGDKTGISWTNATWNPIVGCSIHSPGCKNCYAMGETRRLEAMGVAKYAGLIDMVKGKPVFNGTVRLAPGALDQPLRWKRPRAIFVNSMSDLGHEALDRADVFQVLEIMHFAHWHVFQALTKRPQVLFEHLRAYEPKLKSGCVPPHMAFVHVWFGVSVEDQKRADERLEYAKQLDAAGYRVWVSYEPAIGPVDWTGWEFIAGMVGGGESGPGARPSHPDWHQETRDWCAENGIPYDFKQWGEWLPLGQSGFTAWRAANVRNNGMPSKKWLGFAHFNDGAGGPETARIGPCETASLSGANQASRIGKKLAGNLLDGQIHDGFTRVCAPAGRA